MHYFRPTGRHHVCSAVLGLQGRYEVQHRVDQLSQGRVSYSCRVSPDKKTLIWRRLVGGTQYTMPVPVPALALVAKRPFSFYSNLYKGCVLIIQYCTPRRPSFQFSLTPIHVFGPGGHKSSRDIYAQILDFSQFYPLSLNRRY